MRTERIRNFKTCISIILIDIILSTWFTVLCHILNPNLITMLFLYGTIMAIMIKYIKMLFNEYYDD